MDKPRSKKWMYYDRVSKEYLDGVENFLNYAFRERETISCPCSQCVLYYQINRATAYDHLVVNGVMPSHDTLFCHGESLNESNSTHVNNYRQLTIRGDDMRGMIHDALPSLWIVILVKGVRWSQTQKKIILIHL